MFGARFWMDKIRAVLVITQMWAITEKNCERMKKFVLEITSLSKGANVEMVTMSVAHLMLLKWVAPGTQMLRQHILLDSSLLLDVIACVYTYNC